MTDDRPWHEILVDDKFADRMGDLSQGVVGPMATMRMLLELTGKDEEGKPRLPAMQEVYDSLMKLPTSVDAKRANLAADALARDPWKPKPSGQEWDPDARHDRRRRARGDDDSEPRPGLPRGGR